MLGKFCYCGIGRQGALAYRISLFFTNHDIVPTWCLAYVVQPVMIWVKIRVFIATEPIDYCRKMKPKGVTAEKKSKSMISIISKNRFFAITLRSDTRMLKKAIYFNN